MYLSIFIYYQHRFLTLNSERGNNEFIAKSKRFNVCIPSQEASNGPSSMAWLAPAIFVLCIILITIYHYVL